jgi:hypothetical protein
MSPTFISMRSQCGQCASLKLLVESRILRCDSLKWSPRSPKPGRSRLITFLLENITMCNIAYQIATDAVDVGEGQKQTRCIDSPVRRRGGVERGENGVIILHGKKAPLLHTHRTGLFRPTTALLTPPVGVPASPWTWAKARSKLGALIRLCGDGAVSNEAKMGSFFARRKKAPLLHTHRTGLFRPTTALPTPPVGVPASPWTWAKARS